MNNTTPIDVLLVGYEDEENLGLRSIAAYLKDNSVNVAIEPYHSPKKEVILQKIHQVSPKIVGFSLIFQRMLFDFAELISFLRKDGVSAHFTMGGHFPTIDYKEIFKIIPGLDSVVRHEGEKTLLELYNHIDNSDTWPHIKGIAYRDNGKIRETPPRPLIEDLDTLPFPLRSERVSTVRGLGIYSVLASRGCHYDCSFCSIQTFYREPPGPNRRTRSPSNVARELEELFLKRCGRIFIFKDDDLCTRNMKERRWIKDFCHELKKKKLSDDILWRISCRADEIDADLMRHLKEVGLFSLYIGIESGSNQGLKTCNKHYTVDAVHKGLEILRNLNLSFDFGFMMFDPDSTFTSIRENITFLKTIGKDGRVGVHFTKMFPYAGTPIARRLKKEERLVGTIDSPDYMFEDQRLNLLQHFFSEAFHSWNFDTDGLVNKLQLAKFDAMVTDKYFSHSFDTENYLQTIQEFTRQSNAQALETMSISARFMEKRSIDEILNNWYVLEHLARKELNEQKRLTRLVDQLLSFYDSEPVRYQFLSSLKSLYVNPQRYVEPFQPTHHKCSNE